MSQLLLAKELILGYYIKSVQLQCRVQWGGGAEREENHSSYGKISIKDI